MGTCHCPKYYRDIEGCNECIITDEDCQNGGGNADNSTEICACECPEPWIGRDCTVCNLTCNDVGEYLNETKCECYSICGDGIKSEDEECEQDPKHPSCCVDCKLTSNICNNGDVCTAVSRCDINDGQCKEIQALACTPKKCNTVECVSDVPEGTDPCVYTAFEDKTPCDDGDPCTVNDVCIDGRCRGESKCPESTNPCVRNFCSASGECMQEDRPSTYTCDDGDPCTLNNYCVDGECVPERVITCQENSDPCLDTTCVNGKCADVPHERPNTPCDDMDPCTFDDFCALDGSGKCAGQRDLCDDGNVCTNDRCVNGECSWTDNTENCDDGDLCTRDDYCYQGVCGGVEPVSPATLFVLMMTMMTALVTFALTEVASSEAEIALVLWVLLRKKKSLCLLLRFLNLLLKFLLLPRFLLLLKAFLLSKVVALVAMEAVVSLTVLKTLLLDHGVPE